MAEIQSVDLRNVPNAGPVQFLRAEWKVPRSRFVIVRYSIGDRREEPMGLRLDLDKRVILDDVQDPETSNLVKARAQNIWDIVISYRREHREVYA